MSEQDKLYYQKNKAKWLTRSRRIREENKNNREYKDRRNKWEYNWRNRNYDKWRQSCLKYRAKIKQELFQAYGGKCYCCGETIKEFLTLDHVNGNGLKHRRSEKICDLTLWARRNGFPKMLRLSCYNCNCGRERTKDKICPHKMTLQ